MPEPAATSQTLDDLIDPARARAMQAALGSRPSLSSGDALPPFFHQLYFWDPQMPEHLGRDGHPKTGGLIPDLGLPRRMWAGGELVFHGPLIAGTRAQKVTRIEGVTRKTGRSGQLAFVRLRHDIKQRHALVLTEYQDLVYRADDAPPAEPPKAPKQPAISHPLSFDSTALFRYSALTFNGHRIHYDADYAREVEGYPGLVVHGPLLAQCLMLLAEMQLGALSEFRYQAKSPLIAGEDGTANWADGTAWVTGADGRLCMLAQAG